MSNPTHYSPGTRVEIRDAEWRIRRVDYSSDGGYLLTCEGLSELVQGREATFLTKLETGNIRVLDPVDTDLVDDTSGNFGATLLYIDSQLRKTTPADGKIHLGHRAALDPLDYQLEPALQALSQPRQRILIADAVGLGKTLEAGILVSELIARGQGKRILVLAVKSMLTQFQQEFWTRFTIPLVRLDSTGLQRVRNRVPANHNPFHYFDRAIISIDTLKQDIEYRHHLENAYWDIIIIDEVHNVAERSSNSQRSRLAKLLSTRSDTLIMLSATPHDGKPESFASLVNMLDPTAIANPKDYQQEDFSDKGLVIRRFKKDVREQLQGSFPERQINTARAAATEAEEYAYERLMEVSFHTLDGRGEGTGQLFRTTLEKALFSSPAACLSTVSNRIERLTKQIAKVRDEEVRTTLIEDVDTLEGLRLALTVITPEKFSKFQLLCDQITGMNWTGKDPEDRLVIFTESLVTLSFLQQHLPGKLGLKEKHVAVLRGDMRDKELMDTVDQFTRRESDIRLLLCSDVASEGINLHHLSHRMIHFDIPWALMVFQQRNGRIDRYGQTRQPIIRYLLTESANAKVKGDLHVLEVLIEKDSQAGKNIGDPSEFMGVFDVEEQTQKVAEVMEAPEFDALAMMQALTQQASQAEDVLQNFLPKAMPAPQQQLAPLQRVFPDGLAYAEAALTWFAERGEAIQAGVENGTFWLTAPPDLVQRLNYLPREARPEHDQFILTPDINRITEALKRNRAEEGSAWPALHYLWPIHPVMEWLSDRALNAFGRHTAPVVRLPNKLAENEHIVLMLGGFPNRRGHVLIQEWIAVHVQQTATGVNVIDQYDWPSLQQHLNIAPKKLQNKGMAGTTTALKACLPVVVNAAMQQLKALKQADEQQRKQQRETLEQRLQQLKSKHERQLELELSLSNEQSTRKEQKRTERQSHIDRVFKDYQDWLTNTQTTEDNPYLQVVAFFTGQPAAEH